MAMCRLILRDEAGHIRFHRDRLGAQYPHGFDLMQRLNFYALGFACAAFLWWGQGRWFRTIGVTRSEFFRLVQAGLRRFLNDLARTAAPAHRTNLAVTPAAMRAH